jgi:hypothetical protein
MAHGNDPLLERQDVETLRVLVDSAIANAEALLPRIEKAAGTKGSIHLEERLAKLANTYLSVVGDLLRQSNTLHDAMIESARLMALRRALRPYRGL